MIPPEPMTVLRRWDESADTFSFELDARSRGGFAFLPGQFNMLYAFGVGEVPISVSGDPGRPNRITHTIRDVGPVTRALRKLRRHDDLGVRGPFGAPWPVERARERDLVIVAGGIGLAPLRSVVYTALARRPAVRKLFLAYGARTPGEVLFRAELSSWAEQPGVTVQVTVDRGNADWRGNTGVVTKLLPHFDYEPAQTTAFLCGPEVMMRFAARDLSLSGVASDDIHLSLERNMKCAVGLCGRCQLGPTFVCKDGPVFPHARALSLLAVREL